MNSTAKKSQTQSLQLAAKFHQKLAAIFGEKIRVILYGSQARGEALEDSDIDVLVVLPDLDSATLDIALDAAWEIGFEAGKVLSIIPATNEEMENLSISPFFQAVHREGIPV
ncbi:MAG: nucleotidyltransferase domain-containing protein [Chloroflexota bacterium]|nr:nucleotidyltransferase domain-containing protein [Chloroflexota bacterium]